MCYAFNVAVKCKMFKCLLKEEKNNPIVIKDQSNKFIR
jgi:hypothetical protein